MVDRLPPERELPDPDRMLSAILRDDTAVDGTEATAGSRALRYRVLTAVAVAACIGLLVAAIGVFAMPRTPIADPPPPLPTTGAPTPTAGLNTPSPADPTTTPSSTSETPDPSAPPTASTAPDGTTSSAPEDTESSLAPRTIDNLEPDQTAELTGVRVTAGLPELTPGEPWSVRVQVCADRDGVRADSNAWQLETQLKGRSEAVPGGGDPQFPNRALAAGECAEGWLAFPGIIENSDGVGSATLSYSDAVGNSGSWNLYDDFGEGHNTNGNSIMVMDIATRDASGGQVTIVYSVDLQASESRSRYSALQLETTQGTFSADDYAGARPVWPDGSVRDLPTSGELSPDSAQTGAVAFRIPADAKPQRLLIKFDGVQAWTGVS